MIEIDARCVILNMLQAKESFNLSYLSVFASALKKKVPTSYIDICDDSVLWIVESYPDQIILKEDTISRGPKWELFADAEFLDKSINLQYSEEVRRYIHECAAL